MNEYVMHNGRRFYITNAGCGKHPFAFVDDFAGILTVGADKSFDTVVSAFAAARRAGLRIMSAMSARVAA